MEAIRYLAAFSQAKKGLVKHLSSIGSLWKDGNGQDVQTSSRPDRKLAFYQLVHVLVIFITNNKRVISVQAAARSA